MYTLKYIFNLKNGNHSYLSSRIPRLETIYYCCLKIIFSLLSLLFSRLNHDIARSITTKASHHQLDRVSSPFAERTADSHAQLAAHRCTVRPGKMAVCSEGQPGDRQWNYGLDESVEIFQAPVADRMLEKCNDGFSH